MATITKTFKLEIKMDSEVSEARLSRHFENFVNDIRDSIENHKNEEWNKQIYISHGDFPDNVNIETKLE